MKIVDGNILDIKKGIILHQVNCRGVMGSGLAKQIRDKYPIVFDKFFERFIKNRALLGSLDIVKVSDDLYIANIYGQKNYGRNKSVQYTNYEALIQSISALTYSPEYKEYKDNIYIPYDMGCGLGNGDWNVVSGIIKDIIPTATIIKLNENGGI